VTFREMFLIGNNCASQEGAQWREAFQFRGLPARDKSEEAMQMYRRE
jgi:hypothetical protein